MKLICIRADLDGYVVEDWDGVTQFGRIFEKHHTVNLYEILLADSDFSTPEEFTASTWLAVEAIVREWVAKRNYRFLTYSEMKRLVVMR